MTNNNLQNKRITLAHGAGGRQTAALIHDVFAAHFHNPEFTSDDAAIIYGLFVRPMNHVSAML